MKKAHLDVQKVCTSVRGSGPMPSQEGLNISSYILGNIMFIHLCYECNNAYYHPKS